MSAPDATAANVQFKEPRKPFAWSGVVYWGATIVTLVPIVYMIVYSFNSAPTSRVTFAWNGFTLNWYQHMFEVQGLTGAFLTSLAVALASSVVAILLGLPMALALERHRFTGKGVLNTILFADIAAPSIVVGAASLSFFLTIGLNTGFLTVFIVHVVFNLAYVVIVLRARIAGSNGQLEEAAADLGATPIKAFWFVTLPQLVPGLLASGLMALAMSIDDYVITSFVAGPAVTFPLFVYGAAKVGMPPQVLCFGTLIFCVSILLALVNGVLTRNRPK